MISLMYIISNMTLPSMIYFRVKNDIFEEGEIELSKYKEYRDYIYLPYVKLSELYDAFLSEHYLEKEKIKLHNNENFEVAFRYFIDNNKKYSHTLSYEYFNFEINYLKVIAIKWCNKNHVKFNDDTFYRCN